MDKKKTVSEIENQPQKDQQKEQIIAILKHIVTLLDEIAKNTFKGY